MRRKRKVNAQKQVNVQHADTVVVADNAQVEGSEVTKKRKRKLKTYETTPGWGRQDVPVGKGTGKRYRKVKERHPVGDALEAVE